MGPARRRATRHYPPRVQMGQDGQEAGAPSFSSLDPPPFALPSIPSPNTTLTRVWYGLQQFSDDEGEADQPLAPIQPEDLLDVGEGDDDMDQDEAAGSTAPDMTPGPMSRDVSEPAPSRPGKEEDDGLSKPATPKPHPLSISFQPPTPTPVPDEESLQDALRPPQEGMEGMEGMEAKSSGKRARLTRRNE